jgi:predicted amidohydrolase YtcJ
MLPSDVMRGVERHLLRKWSDVSDVMRHAQVSGATSFVGHDDDGRFVRGSSRPAFEVVCVCDAREWRLSIHAAGDRTLKEELRQVFCWAALNHPGEAAGAG